MLLVDWLSVFERNRRKHKASDAVSHPRRQESQNVRSLNDQCFSKPGWSVVCRSDKMGSPTLVFMGLHA
jgi:hypothetical protein